MREKEIEQQLVVETKKMKGLCEKRTSGTSGWPDRIVILPGSRIGFVEVKAPGKEPRLLSLKRHKQLRALGFKVYVLDKPEQIGAILNDIQTS